MNYDDYTARMRQAVECNQAGDYVQASQLFQNLAAEPDLPDLDRVYMLHNAAASGESVAPPEVIEGLYDQGIALERPHLRDACRKGKAAWLVKQHRKKEALEIYAELMGESWLTWAERRTLEEAIFKAR